LGSFDSEFLFWLVAKKATAAILFLRKIRFMTKDVTNFGHNVEFRPSAIFCPANVEELVGILDRYRGQEIRAVGRLHSWSKAPSTDGVMLDLQKLNSVEVDQTGAFPTVTVGAGCQLKRLVKQLDAHGLALPSLGLIDEQSVAGATATGTHGSGKHSLSHYVEAVSIAHYDELSGEAKITVVDAGPELHAARCSLGLMGVIVSLKFRCRPCYNIEERALAHDSLASVLALETNYPQQQFYLMPWSWRYFGHHRVETAANRSWYASLYRAYCFGVVDVGLHVVVFILVKLLKLAWPVRFFYQRVLPLTIIRNWKTVDNSTDMLIMEHELFRHVEIEVFVRRSQLERATQLLIDVISVFGDQELLNPQATRACLEESGRWDELAQHRGKYVHHYPICFRRIQPDATLISMASPASEQEEDWYAISLISYQWPAERQGFFAFADFVGPTFAALFGGRCHWGKYNPLDRQAIKGTYPAEEEFQNIVQRFDPAGVFKNDWLRELF
jgi:FAD/FMN-containing dehydrogenase